MFVSNKNTSSFRYLSQIFTPSSFSKIIRQKDKDFMDFQIKKYINSSAPESYSDIIHYLYNELNSNYRSEYFFKNALLNKKLLGQYSLNTTTVLNEFKIGKSIADFVLLNGEIRIFEIKTDLDSLGKLEKQISDYTQFADKVYIVASSKHVNKLLSNYNDSSIGIIEFTSNHTLKTLKEAGRNTDNLDHKIIFKSLRKPEYLNLIRGYYGEIPDAPSTRIFKECLELAENINIVDFQKLAIQELKERKLKCPDLLKSDNTPFELKHICYTMDLTEKEYAELYNFLNEKI